MEHLDGDDYSAEGSDASNRSSEVCEGAVADGIGAGIGDYAGTGAVSAVQDRAGEGVGKKDKAVSKEALGMEAVLEAALEEFIQVRGAGGIWRISGVLGDGTKMRFSNSCTRSCAKLIRIELTCEQSKFY